MAGSIRLPSGLIAANYTAIRGFSLHEDSYLENLIGVLLVFFKVSMASACFVIQVRRRRRPNVCVINTGNE